MLQTALEAWAQTNGRALSSSEEYAVAKMRLFQAFDEEMCRSGAEAAEPARPGGRIQPGKLAGATPHLKATGAMNRNHARGV